MGLKEWYNQTLEDLDNRFRNPLILSFIIVWLISQWELVYMIFNFNEKYSLNLKILDIKFYLSNRTRCDLLWNPLWLAFVSLFCFYIIGVTAQLMKLFIGRKLPMYLMGRHDNDKYVPRTDLVKFEESSKKYFKELREKQGELVDMKELADKDLKTIQENTIEIEKLKGEKNDLALNLKTGNANNDDLTAKYNAVTNKNKDLRSEIETISNAREIEKAALDNLMRLNDYSNSVKFDSIEINQIFGSTDVWELYLNGKLHETFRYNNERKVMQTVGREIKITNVKISKSENLVFFEKNTPDFSNLKNRLVMVDKDTLVGNEGNGNKVRYSRTRRLTL